MKQIFIALLMCSSLFAKEKTTIIEKTTNSIKSGASSVVSTIDEARILMDSFGIFMVILYFLCAIARN